VREARRNLSERCEKAAGWAKRRVSNGFLQPAMATVQHAGIEIR
jgi:hypothetical protein